MLHVVVNALTGEERLQHLHLGVEEVGRSLRQKRHGIGLVQRAWAMGLRGFAESVERQNDKRERREPVGIVEGEGGTVEHGRIFSVVMPSQWRGDGLASAKWMLSSLGANALAQTTVFIHRSPSDCHCPELQR